MMMTMQAIAGPGDNVAYISPVWPNIVEAVRICGATPRPVSLDATPEGGWRLDLQKLFASCDARTRGIFVASPGNPTGWMMDAAEIAELLAFCRRRRIWLVVDAVYERLTYGTARAPSPLDVAEPEDPVISLNSFSKAWAMTGWRLGWIVAPPALMEAIAKLNEKDAKEFAEKLAEGPRPAEMAATIRMAGKRRSLATPKSSTKSAPVQGTTPTATASHVPAPLFFFSSAEQARQS